MKAGKKEMRYVYVHVHVLVCCTGVCLKVLTEHIQVLPSVSECRQDMSKYLAAVEILRVH